MKKRIIAMFLAATMAFSLAACGSGNGGNAESAPASSSSEEASSGNEEAADSNEGETAGSTDMNIADRKSTRLNSSH